MMILDSGLLFWATLYIMWNLMSRLFVDWAFRLVCNSTHKSLQA